MKNSMKKLVTLGLVATMTIGSTFTVFAADIVDQEAKEVEGTATINHVEKNVYKISLPTDDALEAALTYVADPQGLIKETDGAQFGTDVEVKDANGIYFKSADGKSVSDTSEDFIITNKSSRGVSLAIEAVLKEADSDKYAGGYSSTADFTGTGDDANGLYIGVQGTNEVKATALTATKADIANVAFTAGDKYETKYAGSAYTYDLKSDAANFPEYSFKVTGAINPDVADSVWGTKAGSPAVYTAKKMPAISIKFTPSLITAKEAQYDVDEAEGAIYLAKKDGTLEDGLLKPDESVTLTVNGKSVTGLKVGKTEGTDLGWIKISWENLCTAYGVDDEKPEEYGDLWDFAKTIQFTVDGVDYVVDIPAK